jgi:plasmid stabilization system protein ParE
VATIRWTVRAQLDLRDIRNYAERTSARDAFAITEYLLTAVRPLADFPRMGRLLPEFDRRDLREILARPYRILYIVRPGDQVEVQAIYHSSQDLTRILRKNPLN